MNRADCKNCVNRINRRYEDAQDYTGRCSFDMRRASTAGGSEPHDLRDVYFCGEYQEDAADDEWE